MAENFRVSTTLHFREILRYSCMLQQSTLKRNKLLDITSVLIPQKANLSHSKDLKSLHVLTVLVCHVLSARPWLRDDLDTWIKRSKVSSLFHSIQKSVVFSSFVRSVVRLFVRSLVRTHARPTVVSYIY